MSKRKRLSPSPLGLPPGDGPLETKAMYPMGVAPKPAPRAPISQVAGNAAAVAALEEVTRSMESARSEGRMVLLLPLEAIDLDHLVRDRIEADDGEMTTLMDSLRDRGQQAPIDVCDLGNGRYGLISGWRRCHALARLKDQTGDEKYGSVLALLRRPDHATEAYRAMVEENEIRADLSHYERARIAVKAVEHGVFETEKAALQCLYHTASRAKRSKIRSFAVIVRALDGALRFPRAISERTGLKLSKALDEDEGLAQRLRTLLAGSPPADAATEQRLIEDHLRPAKPSRTRPVEPQKAVLHPRAGVRVETRADGQIVISGKAVDGPLRDRLLAFLAEG